MLLIVYFVKSEGSNDNDFAGMTVTPIQLAGGAQILQVSGPLMTSIDDGTQAVLRATGVSEEVGELKGKRR